MCLVEVEGPLSDLDEPSGGYDGLRRDDGLHGDDGLRGGDGLRGVLYP